MVWNDEKITQWGQAGGVTPFDPSLVSGASIDLRISDMVAYQKEWSTPPFMRYGNKIEMAEVWCQPQKFSAIYLEPLKGVLLSTLEYVKFPNNAVGQLLSKSTAGRCLIEHCHSGYVDANFEGTLTLEIINFSNVIWELRPGDKLVQLIIFDMVAPALNGYDVTGRYQGQVLPTAPKGW